MRQHINERMLPMRLSTPSFDDIWGYFQAVTVIPEGLVCSLAIGKLASAVMPSSNVAVAQAKSKEDVQAGSIELGTLLESTQFLALFPKSFG